MLARSRDIGISRCTSLRRVSVLCRTCADEGAVLRTSWYSNAISRESLLKVKRTSPERPRPVNERQRGGRSRHS